MVVLAAGGQAARGPVGRPGSAAVGAVVLLDEHSRPAALLKPLLFIVASELALDQDGRLGHLLIECKLQTWGGQGLNWRDRDLNPCGSPPGSTGASL